MELSKKIAGLTFTLPVAMSYVATRPATSGGVEILAVTIHEWGHDQGPRGEPLAVVAGLSRERADELIAAFNGTDSTNGRHWLPETPEEWESLGPMEEGGFDDEDFEAADRAWATIAARNAADLTASDDGEGGEERAGDGAGGNP